MLFDAIVMLFSDRFMRLFFIISGAVALGLVFVFGCFAAWEFTVDDAYISLRYARNLADAHGLVWNRGEAPVEGFTNFLWVIFLAFAELWRADAILVAKVLGVASHAGTTALVGYFVHRETGGRAGPTMLAIAVYLVFLPGYFHAVSGLETVFYGFLLTLAFVIGHRIVTERPEMSWGAVGLPFLGIVLGMTRPDGLLPAAWIILASLLSLGPRGQKKMMGAILVATLIGGAYMIWRVQYFGFLLPNTAYMKAGELSAGMEWLRKTVVFLAPMLVLAVVGASPRWKQEQRGLAFFLGFIAMALAVYTVSNPLMDYLRRFAFPVVAVTVALAAVAVDHQVQRDDTVRGLSLGALLVAVLAASVSPMELSWAGVYGPNLENAHVRLGRELASVEVNPDKRTVAIGDAGAIAYFSGWQAYDFGGLNAPEIAHGGDPTDYVLSRRPTLLVLYSIDGVTVRESQRGLDVSRLTSQYEQLGSIAWHPDYHLLVWARSDLTERDRQALRAATMRAGWASRKYARPLSMGAFADRMESRLGLHPRNQR